MTTIAKVIASLAFLSVLAAPASARFDEDEGGLSAYARFGSAHKVQSADILVNRPIRHHR
jgi:hypothetical protein